MWNCYINNDEATYRGIQCWEFMTLCVQIKSRLPWEFPIVVVSIRLPYRTSQTSPLPLWISLNCPLHTESSTFRPWLCGVCEYKTKKNFPLINFPLRPDVLCKKAHTEKGEKLKQTCAVRNRSPHKSLKYIVTYKERAAAYYK